MPSERFADAAIRFEMLLQQLGETPEPARRTQILRQMKNVIGEAECLEYDQEPSKKTLVDAVRIAKQLLENQEK
jgi:hypothetical protein